MGQRQSEIIKNHMEVYWHDYASASKGIPITEAGLVEKGICHWPHRVDAAGMRHGCMACPKFYEYPLAGTGRYDNGRHRSAVHRVHLF